MTPPEVTPRRLSDLISETINGLGIERAEFWHLIGIEDLKPETLSKRWTRNNWRDEEVEAFQGVFKVAAEEIAACGWERERAAPKRTPPAVAAVEGLRPKMPNMPVADCEGAVADCVTSLSRRATVTVMTRVVMPGPLDMACVRLREGAARAAARGVQFLFITPDEAAYKEMTRCNQKPKYAPADFMRAFNRFQDAVEAQLAGVPDGWQIAQSRVHLIRTGNLMHAGFGRTTTLVTDWDYSRRSRLYPLIMERSEVNGGMITVIRHDETFADQLRQYVLAVARDDPAPSTPFLAELESRLDYKGP